MPTGIADPPPDWRRASLIALDTAPLLYHFEGHALLGPRILPVLSAIESGHPRGAASALALLELLVGPYRSGNEPRRDELTLHLLSFPHLDWIPLSLVIADRAASLRARYNLRTPDAIHVATAIAAGAELFLTNDRDLRRITEIPVLMVEDLPAA